MQIISQFQLHKSSWFYSGWRAIHRQNRYAGVAAFRDEADFAATARQLKLARRQVAPDALAAG